HYPAILRIDSLKVMEGSKELNIWFPDAMSFNPVREDALSRLENSIRETLGRKFRGYRINMFTNGISPEQLIPNYFRHNTTPDTARIPSITRAKPVMSDRVDGVHPSMGLNNRYIALWHSHGYYYDIPLDRWEWQRAKLFGSVEDLSVMAYVIPYLAPMLENAGATIFIPRERDIQVNEVVVDNDRSFRNSEFVIHAAGETEQTGEGFLMKDTLFSGENPFRLGTSLRISDGSVIFIPDIPEKGYYSVCVSYPRLKDNSEKVRYRISHSGGSTDFIVNQTMGGGTWLYLGSYLFNAGTDQATGSVTVTCEDGGKAAIDAVRFGGGMGNVARRPSSSVISNQLSVNAGAPAAPVNTSPDTVRHTWKLSGKPRYLEGARYWLQYAGMPDTLVYSPNRGKNDYNDDYMSRAEWVNYLAGIAGPDNNAGLGIPVDLSLAFHTDAGITTGDSIIGTLGIYSTAAGEGKFIDGKSRLASRDLSDIIQTQIVEDIEKLFNPAWTRRGLWDKSYYEARKPGVPAMLLELLSHQNLADQRFGLDPRFRFQVSRAVYKGILKYLSFNSGSTYAVQPLPVTHMALTSLGGKRVRLSWEPVIDPLEPTAAPASYRVYTRTGDNGFDNGQDVSGIAIEIELPAYDTIYSFRVTAVNDGGESFPSETLAAGFGSGAAETVLVVNGFDRISGPAWFDRDGMAGVEWWNDRGVADRYNFAATGDQYDFYRWSPWTDDDNPGWGASYSDLEGRIIAGNTFDYPYLHGRSIMAAGRSFISVSDEVFTGDSFDFSPYSAADLIFGEEKTTFSVSDSARKDFQIYTPEFIRSLEKMKAVGLPLFMSGSYIGSDMQITGDTTLQANVKTILHFKHRSDHAVRNGNLYATDIAWPDFTGTITFNTSDKSPVYAAEAPDAVEPADKGSFTAFRYSENNTSAAVIYRGKPRIVVMGFPFETIISAEERDEFMKQILNFLKDK
ncbi:MAG: xanthan lyase, partial [Bacteroidales bacterium]